jgi:hypothetical protein
MLTYYKYAALSKTPHALADGLMLVFQHPYKQKGASKGAFHSLNGLPLVFLSLPVMPLFLPVSLVTIWMKSWE